MTASSVHVTARSNAYRLTKGVRTRCQAQNGSQALPGWFERSHLAGDGASGGTRCNGIHGGRAKARWVHGLRAYAQVGVRGRGGVGRFNSSCESRHGGGVVEISDGDHDTRAASVRSIRCNRELIAAVR
eukprot:1046506-Prymnesium_polylepis.1